MASEQDEIAARIGRVTLAAGALGLDGTMLAPVWNALGPELARSLGVRVAGDLMTLAVVVRCQVADSGERLKQLMLDTLKEPERGQQLLAQLGSGGECLFQVVLGRYGLRLGVERVSGQVPGQACQRLVELGALKPDVAGALAARAGELGPTADLIGDERRGTRRVLRTGVLLPARPETGVRLARAMGSAGVERRQREYFEGTFPVLTLRERWLVARAAATPEGLLPEIAVTFPHVIEQTLLTVWETLCPVAELGRRLGAVTGLLGVDRGALELRLTDKAPALEATFELAGLPSQLGALKA